MEESRIDEMGNLLLVKKPSTFKNKVIFQVTTKEWIQLLTERGPDPPATPASQKSPQFGRRQIWSSITKEFSWSGASRLSPRLAKESPFFDAAISQRVSAAWTELGRTDRMA